MATSSSSPIVDPSDPPVVLPGSEKQAPEAVRAMPADPDARLDVTVRIKRRTSLAPRLTTEESTTEPISRSDYARHYGASPAVIRQVAAFAAASGLTVTMRSTGRRMVQLRGTVQQMSRVFGVALADYERADGTVFRGRSGPIYVPASLVDAIEGVFGLDNRPQAHTHFQIYESSVSGVDNPRAVATSFTPPQLARLYNYPTGVTGKGQCIALIELGGGSVRPI